MLIRSIKLIVVLLAMTFGHAANAVPNPEAAKQARLQGQRLLQGIQSIREQYQSATKDHPEVQKALEAFAADKQAEADATNQLAAAQEDGAAEKIETATQALAARSAASKISWQSLQGTIAASTARDQVKNVQGELDRVRKQYGAMTEEGIKEALADYLQLGQAEIDALEKVATAHEQSNQGEVRASGLAATRAQTERRDKLRVLQRRGTAAQLRREAQSLRDEAKKTSDLYAKENDAPMKAAAEAVVKAREAEAVAKDAIAVAQAEGKDEDVPKLQESWQAASEVTRIANVALDARNTARQRTPTPEWIENTRKGTPATAMAEFDATVTARTQAVAAWQHLAEVAAAPKPTNDQIEEARDLAIAADALSNLADRRRTLANELVRYTDMAKQSGSGSLLEKAKELQQTQEKLLDAMKQQCDLQAVMRPLERKRNATRDQCEQVFRQVQRR